MRYKPFLMLVAVFALLSISFRVMAQEEDAAGTVLAMIPDVEASRVELSYANYQAMFEAWGAADARYEDIINRTEAGEAWFDAITSFRSGLELSTLMIGMSNQTTTPNMRDTLGFSMADIDQAAVYGLPPGRGSVLTGEFDLAAIRNAHVNRDYQPHTMDGVEVWCAAAGCDTGLRQNLRETNPANIFGGQFGRSEPIALLDGAVLNSPELTVLETLIETQQSEQPSLLDAPEYQTFVEAMSAYGEVVQFWVFDPAVLHRVGGMDLLNWDLANFPMPEPVRENVIASAATFGELPPYELMGIAHVWDGTDHLAVWALIYEDAAAAETAADELHSRLTNAASIVTRGFTYGERIAENSEVLPPATYEGAEGAAALFVARAIEGDEGMTPQQAILTYRFFAQMVGSRDLYFLGSTFVLP